MVSLAIFLSLWMQTIAEAKAKINSTFVYRLGRHYGSNPAKQDKIWGFR
jgi:hypothetical protein